MSEVRVQNKIQSVITEYTCIAKSLIIFYVNCDCASSMLVVLIFPNTQNA